MTATAGIAVHSVELVGDHLARDERQIERVSQLFESVGLEPTRAGKGVQLPSKQTAAWLDWIGDPVPGVGYKWAATPEEYEDAKRDAKAFRARLWNESGTELSDTASRDY